MKSPSVRIESGKFKGKRLLLPSFATTRSTKSRVRACVFNTLRGELKDKVFVEVFGGSGAMAFEALSNDALGVIIIEKDEKAYKIACENARMLLKGENSGACDKAGLNFRGNSRNSTLGAVNFSVDLETCENVGLKFNGNLGKFDCKALNSNENFENFACETLNSNENSNPCNLQSLNFNENSEACGLKTLNFGENSSVCGLKTLNFGENLGKFDCEALNFNENSRNFAVFGAKNVRIFNASFVRERVLIFNADSFELLPILLKDEKFSQNVIAYFDPPFHLRDGFENIYERIFTLINSLQSSNLQGFIIEHSHQITTPATFGAFTQHKFKKFGNTSLSFYHKI